MAEKHKATARKRIAETRGRALAKNTVGKYSRGDYLNVELLPGTADTAVSVWIHVDHCDDQHAIVFGTIDGEPFQQLGNALKRGMKLAANYRQVREHRASLRP